MIECYLIKPFTSLEKLNPVDLTLFSEVKLAVKLNDPYLLNIRLGKNSPVYDLFKTESNIGLRIIETVNNNINFDVGFVKNTNSQVENLDGSIKLIMESTISLLEKKFIRTLPYFKVFSGKVFDLVSQIANINFNLVGSQNPNINYQTGSLNCYELLKDICDTTSNFSFRDGGIVNNTQKIDVGNFDTQSIEIFVNSQSDTKIIGNPKFKINGKIATHCLAFGNVSSGEGASEKSTITLDKSNYDFIQSGYPLEFIGDVTNSGKAIFRVVNQNLKNILGYNILDDFVTDISSNTTTDNGQQIFNINDAIKTVYQRTVNKLKNQNFNYSLDVDFLHNQIIKAGTKLNIKFEYENQFIDGTNSFKIDQDLILYNEDYDILQLLTK